MNAFVENFWVFAIAAVLVFTTGLYLVAASRNLVRILIGIELLGKAVTLMLLLAGAMTGRMALVQTLIITLIVIEVVVLAVGAGIVVGAHRHSGDISTDSLSEMKG